MNPIIETIITTVIATVIAGIVFALFKKVYQRLTQKRPSAEEPSVIEKQEILIEEPEVPIRALNMRFEKVWKLLFENGYNQHYSTAEIADQLDIPQESTLENYRNGKKEIPIPFLKTFAERYHTNLTGCRTRMSGGDFLSKVNNFLPLLTFFCCS